MDIRKMKAGDLVLVHYGRGPISASQIARIISIDTDKGPLIEKWLDSSRRWSSRRRARGSDVIGFAPPNDPRRRRAEANLPSR